MNRRNIFKLIGGALCAAALELGRKDTFVEVLNKAQARLIKRRWYGDGVVMHYTSKHMPRWDWNGKEWVRVENGNYEEGYDWKSLEELK